MSGPATLADLRKWVQASVRRLGRQFTRPDDDWLPVLFVQTPEGIEILGISPEFFATADKKDALADALRDWIRRGAFRYALLLNTHARQMNDEEMKEHIRGSGRIADLPGAVEALVLNVGDAEQEELWMAKIRRREKLPPTLESWEKWEAAEEPGRQRFLGLNEAIREPRR